MGQFGIGQPLRRVEDRYSQPIASWFRWSGGQGEDMLGRDFIKTGSPKCGRIDPISWAGVTVTPASAVIIDQVDQHLILIDHGRICLPK